MRRGFPVWVLSVGLTLCSVAGAQQPERDRARQLMEDGDAMASKEDLSGALANYQKADAIMHVPSTGVAVARVLASMGRLVEARDKALAVTRIPVAEGEREAMARARQEAQRLAQRLAESIPSLQLVLHPIPAPSGLTLAIDGKQVPAAAMLLPHKLDPGSHVVAVAAPDYYPTSKTVELTAGASSRVEISLQPVPRQERVEEQPGAGPSPIMWVGFAVGGVGLVLGAVTGGMSLSRTSSAKDLCDGNVCPPGAKDDIDSAKTMANVSNVAFGVGALGIGVGLWALFSAKPSASRPVGAGTSLVVGATHLGVEGRF